MELSRSQSLDGLSKGLSVVEDARILLVDDERLVRRSMEKTLLRAGFDVDTAENALNGLALFEEAIEGDKEKPFDLAILDLNMPSLDGAVDANAGLHLLSRLLEIDKDLPVIVLTNVENPQIWQVLTSKPNVVKIVVKTVCTPFDLVDEVTAVLGE